MQKDMIPFLDKGDSDVYDGVTVLTDSGLRLIGKLLAQQGALKITRAVVGDGQLPEGSEPEARTGLVSPLMGAQISECLSSGNGEATIAVQLNSPDVQTGFFVREIGVYALDPDLGEILYAYLTYGNRPEWIRPSSSKNPKLITFYLTIILDQISQVDVEISLGALVYRRELMEILPIEKLITLYHDLNDCPTISVFSYQYGAGMGGAGNGPAGGTSLMEIPTKIEYTGKDSLTIYTTKSAARPGIEKALHKISDTEYILTYKDNDIDTIYIKLLPKLRLKSHLSHELATLYHGLGTYPQAIAGILQYGAGVAGAGIGPAGGTDIEQIPIRTVWHDNESLTLYTEEDIQPDALSEVRRVSDSEYVITYTKGMIDSIYIRLLTGQFASVLTPPSDTDMMVSVAAQAVNAHNNSQYAHPDIRLDGGKF